MLSVLPLVVREGYAFHYFPSVIVIVIYALVLVIEVFRKAKGFVQANCDLK